MPKRSSRLSLTCNSTSCASTCCFPLTDNKHAFRVDNKRFGQHKTLLRCSYILVYVQHHRERENPLFVEINFVAKNAPENVRKQQANSTRGLAAEVFVRRLPCTRFLKDSFEDMPKSSAFGGVFSIICTKAKWVCLCEMFFQVV